jgi:hypothetical protein
MEDYNYSIQAGSAFRFRCTDKRSGRFDKQSDGFAPVK